jgi:hypothetical protein
MQINMIAFSVKYSADIDSTYTPLHSRASPYLPWVVIGTHQYQCQLVLDLG